MTSHITNPSAKAHANRSNMLRQQQERMAAELASQQAALEQAATMRKGINSKFSSSTEESSSSSVTYSDGSKQYGLVTLSQMQKQQQEAEEDRRKQMLAKSKAQKAAKKRKKLQLKATLSFDMDEEDAMVEDPNVSKKAKTAPKAGSSSGSKKKQQDPEAAKNTANNTSNQLGRLGKNPEVDTSFLPDKEREEFLKKRKEQLMKDWVKNQEVIKKEKVIIGFSYWDGSDHMRKTKVFKGDTIATFIKRALKTVRHDHPELRNVSVEDLVFIRDSVMLPQHLTFYDLILHNAHNKGKLFFEFEGPKLKKDDPRATKMCLKNWYEMNKHIFPASLWETYDVRKHQVPLDQQ